MLDTMATLGMNKLARETSLTATQQELEKGRVQISLSSHCCLKDHPMGLGQWAPCGYWNKEGGLLCPTDDDVVDDDEDDNDDVVDDDDDDDDDDNDDDDDDNDDDDDDDDDVDDDDDYPTLDTRISFVRSFIRSYVTLRGPPWILKRAGLESSGQIASS